MNIGAASPTDTAVFSLEENSVLSGDITAGVTVGVNGAASAANVTTVAALVNSGTIALETVGGTLDSNLSITGVLTNDGLVDVRVGTGGNRMISGDLINNNSVNLATNAGARLVINGDFSQTTTGELNMELGGTTAGVTYDVMNILGQAILDGTLIVALIDDFQPSLGDSFEVLTFGSHAGMFASITGLDLGGGLVLEPVYNGTNLTLEVVQN